MKNILFITILSLGLLAVCGCGLKNSDESSHPLFIRAGKARNANEMELAVKYYKRYLSINPKSSKTHLLVASIYDESLDKPLLAIYHYQRFLELVPRSSESENVKKWLEAAQRKYYNRTRLKYNDPEDVSVLQNTLFTTERELKKYKQEVKKLKLLQSRLALYARKLRDSEQKQEKELNKLKSDHGKTLKEMQKLKKELEDIRNKQNKAVGTNENKDEEQAKSEEKVKEEDGKKEVEKTEKTEDKVTEITEIKDKPEAKTVAGKTDSATGKSDSTQKPLVPEAESTPAAAKAKAEKKDMEAPAFMLTRDSVKNELEQKVKKTAVSQIYTVRKGDSLSAISRHFYGSSKYYKLIFDANRDVLSSETSLLPGQVLKIPPLKK